MGGDLTTGAGTSAGKHKTLFMTPFKTATNSTTESEHEAVLK